MPLTDRAPVRHALRRLAAVALVLAATAACTSEEDPPPASPAAAQAGAAAASSPSAELQAGLTALLVERAYAVAASTTAIAAAGGVVAPPADAALTALDGTSVALADLLGAMYSDARIPLLEALRRDDRLVARHAVALAAGDRDQVEQVRRELEGAQDELAQVVRRVVPTLDASEAAMQLAVDLRAQLAVGSYDELRRAADASADAARLLAVAVAADRGLGSPVTAAVQLRTDLTGLLTEHVLLSAALARELRRPGLASTSARVALAGNAEDLADALGQVYPAARATFLRSWQAHLGRLEAYAGARASGAAATAERAQVSAYAGELAGLLSEPVDGLPAQSARAELEPALAAQLTAVDEAAAATAEAPQALRTAVTQVLPAAALLSAAVAEDLQLT